MCFLDGLAMLAAEQPCPLVDIILPGFKIIRDFIQLCRAFGIACR